MDRRPEEAPAPPPATSAGGEAFHGTAARSGEDPNRTGPSAGPIPTRDLRTALSLATLCTAGVGLLRWVAGLGGALGTDAPLWGLTARDLVVGAAPLVPPLYPALIAPAVAVGGSPVWWGGVVSAVALGSMVGFGYLLARQLSSSAPVAIGLALSPLLLPDTVGWAVQLQPDAAAAAWSMALALALARLRPGAMRDWRPTLPVVLLGAVAPLLREHGLAWATVAGAGLLLRGGRAGWMVLTIPVLMWIAPVAVGVTPGVHPLDVPWGDRAGGALAAFTASTPDTLPYLHELHRADRLAYSTLVTSEDRLGQLLWHLRRSLRLAPDGWLLWGLAIAFSGLSLRVAASRDRAVAALPLLAALPALIIWSQRRHVLLVVPLAIVLLGVDLSPRRRALSAAMVALLVHGLVNWPNSLAAWQTEVPRARHYAELGDWLATHSQPGDLLGGIHQDVGLYSPPLPRHDPDGSPADWRTFLVTDRRPPTRTPGTWEVVFRGPTLSIWQLDPQQTPRPCAEHPTPANASHIAVAKAHVALPDCREPFPTDAP